MIKYADLNTEPTLTRIRGSYSWVGKDSRFIGCDRRVDWQLSTFLTTAFYTLKEAASFSVNIYQRKRSYIIGVLVFVSLITSVWLSKKLFWDDFITHTNTHTYIYTGYGCASYGVQRETLTLHTLRCTPITKLIPNTVRLTHKITTCCHSTKLT